MDGFIFFLVFIFVIVPIFKGIFGTKKTNRAKRKTSPKKTKNWAGVQRQIQAQVKLQAAQNAEKKPGQATYGKRGQHGHSNARALTNSRLHAQDSDSNVFPEDHDNRVKKRRAHARSERNRIEAMLHSRKNRAIVRDKNKGLDDWGARGDTKGGALMFVILLAGIVFIVLNGFAPTILEFLNIK